MPRYFFHRTDGFVEHDADGTELLDLVAARNEAVRFAGRSISEDPSFVWDGREFRVHVTDVDGRFLFAIVILAIDSPAESRTVTA